MIRKSKLLIIIAVIILGGCGEEYERPVLEDLGIIGVLGFDYVEGDAEKVKVTATFPQHNKDAEERTQIYSATVKLPHKALLEITTKSEKVLTLAQLRVLIFSEEYAQKVGLWNVLYNLYRDPRVGTNVFIAVVKGSAEEFLSQEYKDKPNINVYLNEKLEPKEDSIFNPHSTLHAFLMRATDEVSDPSTPYLEYTDGTANLSHVALFNKDKMVGVLGHEEGKMIETFKQRDSIPDMLVEFTEKDESGKEVEKEALLTFVDTFLTEEVSGTLENPKVHLHLYVRGTIEDYVGIVNLESLDAREDFESKFEEHFEKKIIKVVNTLQELQSDPGSFGEGFRIKYPHGWSKERWNEAFANAEITANAKVTIISTGATK
ncbi:Ger(x)C family spore germination protein [Bacillus alkalicellulosilyticus]|uniref:Ger(x)C family spore germination protein n=1 Tax=Alkalihalobacterium alkalicellulosilyticum TaxID=1912214 RepID=UPI0014831FA3|nr:Ger(x)C family spore germination protein [Bacillus alkalicellulosilyticus]